MTAVTVVAGQPLQVCNDAYKNIDADLNQQINYKQTLKKKDLLACLTIVSFCKTRLKCYQTE